MLLVMKFSTKVDTGGNGQMTKEKKMTGRNNRKITKNKMEDGQKVRILEMNLYGMR